ncbi:efflux RND transporter periplasmic adaptor subunit [Nocardioides cavernaquae]|uniref:Biotin/lipoyl-binding protein n=1 Tax=Nocardioides cavernaquae TaxID=2321396 RepID=A0A3A5H6F6_9ACTN|nr:biotin/lipoyl-binding protein [Nocardioides cavernaquae]RJS45541.1 biotin/lipoyl-binding protein [Nocardioides cavernaquae]
MRFLKVPFATPRRRLILAAAAVLLAGCIWFLWPSDARTASTTVTAEATSSTIKDTVTGSGTLEAARSEDLSFASSGTVTAVNVKTGDRVKKGDVLARIDTASLQAALTSAQAQLDSAETTAANDGSETASRRAANTAAVASARAGVAEAQDALDAATLKAPFTAMVATVDIAVGDQVSASSGAPTGSAGSTGTTAAITVMTPRSFVVTADVSADDVARLTTTMQAEVTPAGATDPLYGTVTAVGKVAEVSDSGTATFPVTVTLTGKQDDLYAGTSVDVAITVSSRDDVLTVPTAAVTTEGDATYVQKVSDGSTTKTEVEIGETYGPTTEIVSGLAAGDTVSYTRETRMPGGGTGGVTFPGGGELPPGFEGGTFPGGGTFAGGSLGGAR